MDAPPDLAAPPPTHHSVDWLTLVATYFSAALVFYPLAHWLFRTTEASEQLFHALIVLGAAGIFLLFERRRALHLILRHDRVSLGLLMLAFVLAGVTVLVPDHVGTMPEGVPQGLVMLAAFGVMLASLVHYTLGPMVARAARGLIVAFMVFSLLGLFQGAIDWPLRALAGKLALFLLGLLGQTGNLHLVNTPEPELILSTGVQSFRVAAECNGFGLLSAAILVTVLLGVYRKLVALDFLLVLLLASLTALLANALRILGIVLLAPHVSNYQLMHEGVGLVVYYAALVFLWWFVWGFPGGKSAKGDA